VAVFARPLLQSVFRPGPQTTCRPNTSPLQPATRQPYNALGKPDTPGRPETGKWQTALPPEVTPTLAKEEAQEPNDFNRQEASGMSYVLCPQWP